MARSTVTATEASPAPPRRWRLRCPRCARAVRRVRRSRLQRALLGAKAIAQFRCVDAGCCGWSGLLARRQRRTRANPVRWPLLALRGFVPLALAGLAVVAAQWGAARAPVAQVDVGARRFARARHLTAKPCPRATRCGCPWPWRCRASRRAHARHQPQPRPGRRRPWIRGASAPGAAQAACLTAAAWRRP